MAVTVYTSDVFVQGHTLKLTHPQVKCKTHWDYGTFLILNSRGFLYITIKSSGCLPYLQLSTANKRSVLLSVLKGSLVRGL